MSTRRRSTAEVAIRSTPGLLYGLLLLVALGFAGMAVTDARDAARLHARGVTTQARVAGREPLAKSCGKHRSSECRTYRITYTFETAEGAQTLVRDEKLDPADVPRTGAGLAIRYLPDDTAVTEFMPGSTRTEALHTAFFAAVLAVAVGLGLSRIARRARRMVRVRDRGEARQATVTGHRDTKARVNGAPLWVVEWRDDAGARGEGFARFGIGLPPLGSRITVYADPAGDLPPAWEGDVGGPRAAVTAPARQPPS